MKKLFILLILPVFVIGCQSQMSEADLEEINKLQPATASEEGEYVILNGAGLQLEDGLKLMFSNVLADSRCPSTAVCLWMGQVEIAFTLQENGEIQNIVLGLGENIRKEAEWGTHRFELVEVYPYPDGSKLNFKDYSVKVRVSSLVK